MKRKNKKLRKVGKAMRASAPPLPGDRMLPDAQPQKPVPPVKAQVVISKKELESLQEGLGELARSGNLADLAAHSFAQGLLESRDVNTLENSRRHLRISAAVAGDDRALRAFALMMQVRQIMATFNQYDHEPKRLRHAVGEALALAEQARTAAWGDDLLVQWIDLVLKDLRKRELDVGPNPDEPVEDSEEQAEEPAIDEDADAEPTAIEIEENEQ